MAQLEILIATVNQVDFSLVSHMNINCNAIIANQAGKNETLHKQYPFGTVKMLTTDTIGVGHNRNIALEASEADLVLFADDDVVYQENAAQEIIQAFRDLPDADLIIFGMDYTKNGKLIEQRHLHRKRRRLHNSLRFGAVSIAARRNALIRAGVHFNENFGGGCRFSSGEDSLFLADCYRSKLKVYSHEYVLGQCARDNSSWFIGYNEKYFFDKGVLMGLLFPRWKYFMTLYFAIHFKRRTDISVFQRIYFMYQGLFYSKKVI